MFAKPTENPNGKSSNQFMEIKSYHGPRNFFAIFLLALEPQGGSRDEIKPIFIVLNLSLIQTLGISN